MLRAERAKASFILNYLHISFADFLSLSLSFTPVSSIHSNELALVPWFVVHIRTLFAFLAQQFFGRAVDTCYFG